MKKKRVYTRLDSLTFQLTKQYHTRTEVQYQVRGPQIRILPWSTILFVSKTAEARLRAWRLSSFLTHFMQSRDTHKTHFTHTLPITHTHWDVEKAEKVDPGGV